ncbi:MAG: T9SS type A sorting domain-containing protein [Candidatus Latescibacterota bacterium]|nr:MAG: T9SS type A sorting domain-containing protein [Candidatus Latescibacterota bacterium]
MDNSNEDFWVQYYDGFSWHTVAVYAQGIDFDNGVFYNKVVSIPKGTYNYSTNARLRFMCDASGNADDVYIDEIEFRGLTGGATAGDIAVMKTSEPLAPHRFSLSQNYPNPFNPTTTISFSLAKASHVRLEIFDIAGRRVATLVDESKDAGPHHVEFDASSLSSGIYIYRIKAGDMTESRKMMLIK